MGAWVGAAGRSGTRLTRGLDGVLEGLGTRVPHSESAGHFMLGGLL